jgi:hypothetical protein
VGSPDEDRFASRKIVLDFLLTNKTLAPFC